MSTPAPGWYPSPRDPGLQAWWDGQAWHLDAKQPTAANEIAGWIIGLTAGFILAATFPPALVLVGIVALAWYLSNQNKKKRARAQWQWDHPAEHEWAKFTPAQKKQFIDDIGLRRKDQPPR